MQGSVQAIRLIKTASIEQADFVIVCPQMEEAYMRSEQDGYNTYQFANIKIEFQSEGGSQTQNGPHIQVNKIKILLT